MAKSGMQMMIESLIGPELQNTMNQIPGIADALTNKVNAMDAKLDRILQSLENIPQQQSMVPVVFQLPENKS